jgi:hypothetical protein
MGLAMRMNLEREDQQVGDSQNLSSLSEFFEVSWVVEFSGIGPFVRTIMLALHLPSPRLAPWRDLERFGTGVVE